jgi:activator of HSP90 ATPase
LKKKNSLAKRNSAKKSKSTRTTIAAASTKGKKKSKSINSKSKSKSPSFKSDVERRHHEALKAGFQNAEEYETFLRRQKEARKLAGEPEPRVPATISEETITKEVLATTNE